MPPVNLFSSKQLITQIDPRTNQDKPQKADQTIRQVAQLLCRQCSRSVSIAIAFLVRAKRLVSAKRQGRRSR